MKEKQIISEIKKLQQIKPRQDWVFLTKKAIFEEKTREFDFKKDQTFIGLKEMITGLRFVLGHKYAFASLIILVVLITGTFIIVQNSLPGDSLYPVKKITERSQAIFSLSGEQTTLNLKLANRRLDDLTRIAKSNSIENLASAINEYKASVSRAAEELIKENPEDLERVKEIVLEVKKLEENKQKVMALGVVIDGTEELDNALAQLVEREIKDLETRALTENQQEILDGMKKDYENQEYSQALEKILFFNNKEK